MKTTVEIPLSFGNRKKRRALKAQIKKRAGSDPVQQTQVLHDAAVAKMMRDIENGIDPTDGSPLPDEQPAEVDSASEPVAPL